MGAAIAVFEAAVATEAMAAATGGEAARIEEWQIEARIANRVGVTLLWMERRRWVGRTHRGSMRMNSYYARGYFMRVIGAARGGGGGRTTMMTTPTLKLKEEEKEWENMTEAMR
jgi:hypothetical protein